MLRLAAFLTAISVPATHEEGTYENRAFGFRIAPGRGYQLRGYDRPCKTPTPLWKWTDALCEFRNPDIKLDGIVLYWDSALTARRFADWREEAWKKTCTRAERAGEKALRDRKEGDWLVREFRIEFQDYEWRYLHLFIAHGKHNYEVILTTPETMWEENRGECWRILDTVRYGEPPAEPATVVAEDAWSGCAPGSWVRYRVALANSGSMEIFHVLLDHEEGKSYTVRTHTITAKVTTNHRPAKYVVAAPPPEGEKSRIETGGETVRIPRGEYKCTWTMTISKHGWRKVWACAEVPFRIVKMESEISGVKSAMELLDFEKK